MGHGAGDILIAVLQRLGQTWQQIFTTHLAYTAVGIGLLAPLVGAVSRVLLYLSGQTVLADQDIVYFLLTPLGMASLIVMAALVITIVAFEQASMMAIGTGAAHGRHVGTVAALRFAAARAGSVLSLATRLVIRVLVLTLPFVAAGAAVVWTLLTDHDVNYYLAQRPRAFWIALTLVGLLLLVMLVLLFRKLLAWCLAFPLGVFAGVPPARCFPESERLTRGQTSGILASFAAWALAALALGTIVASLVHLLGSLIAPYFYHSVAWLVPVLGALIVLWLLGNLVVTAFNAGSFAFIMAEYHERYAPGPSAAIFEDTPRHGDVLGWRLTPSRLAVILLGGASVAALVGVWLVNGIQVRDEVTVIAHRGAAGKAPENTLAAVHQAVRDGADWIEIDVQETADGEIVVIHDSDFMKLSGTPLKVWEGTLEQIREIDVGSWFGPEFESERVPTLREVLDQMRGKSRVVIELKYYGHDQQLEQRVVEIVEQADMVPDVAVMSLKYDGIRKIRTLRPEWSVGLLSAKAVGDLTTLDADFLAVNMSMATPRFVRAAHASGKQVFVWTVNDPVSMSRMMSLGVDGIITDEPEMARGVLGDRAELSSVERLMLHTAVLFGRPLPQHAYRDESP